MAYKDRGKEREAARLRKRRQRDVTPFVMPTLPLERMKRIEHIIERRRELGCPDDSKARWNRANEYRKWEAASV